MTTGRTSIAQVALAIAALTATGCSSTAAQHTAPPRGAGATTVASEGGRSPLRVDARYSAKSLGLKDPANLAVGPDGNLYVADARQRVTVLSPDGKVIRHWGTPGSGHGEFNFVPHANDVKGVSAGIAVGPDGRVYVADTGNSRIQVFSPNGGFIRSFGGFGAGKNQLVFPAFLAADGADNVYVAEDGKQTLEKFSSTGAVQWVIGTSSASDSDLVGHFHVSSSSIDAHGRVVVANDDQDRVMYLDAQGNKVDVIGSPETYPDGACDVAIDRAGYVFVNSCTEPLDSPHYTEVFDRSHHLVGTWHPSPLGWAPRFGPHGEIFALGDDGSILRLRLTISEG